MRKLLTICSLLLLTPTSDAATRFRLPASGSAAVSPAFQSYSHTNSVRRPMPTTDSTTLALTVYAPDGSDHLVLGDAVIVQFVSAPLAVQNLTAQNFQFAFQSSESHANNNLANQI